MVPPKPDNETNKKFVRPTKRQFQNYTLIAGHIFYFCLIFGPVTWVMGKPCFGASGPLANLLRAQSGKKWNESLWIVIATVNAI